MLKNRFNKIVLGIGLLSSIAFVGFKTDDRYFEIAKNLEIFVSAFKDLNALYVDEVNPTKSIRIGLTAMLKDLDPYTNFFAEDDIEDYMTVNAGKYNGIGATVATESKKHTVVMIYEESPADKVGIKIGDEIISINGIDVRSKDEEEFARLLKGQTGTSVKLKLIRFGKSSPVEFVVNRDIVKTPNVPNYGMIDKEVGYIQLTDFSATAAKEIKTAFLEMKGLGMNKVIIDLRGNPGGLLNMAVDICNFFIPKNLLVVETKGKVVEWNKKFLTQNEPLDTNIPVIVLINGKSASASEIVSGTLQDYDRGVVLGQKSFGKGLVQITRPLVYSTQIKITTAKYYTPSGRCIQAIDYSHKNEDGSVSKLADSLKSMFKTKNGRIVYDGGGVDPDFYTNPKSISEFTKNLLENKFIFNYATKYYFENANTKPGNNFEISDAQFDDFSNWLKKSNFNYKSSEEKSLDALIENSKKNGTFKTHELQIESLSKSIKDQKNKNLIANKEEIKDQLNAQILSRYYYQKAMKFVSFEKDVEVQAALGLFKDMNKYKSLLIKK